MVRIWATPLLGLVLSLVLVAAACSAPADQPVGSPDEGADEQETTRRTIREEAATTSTTRFTASADLGPLPDADWTETEFVLQLIAETDGALAMATRPGGDDLWIAERSGRVRVIQRRVALDNKTEALKLLNTVVLDISDKVSTDGERGLLGLDFSDDGDMLYVSYTNNNGHSVVAEYEMDAIRALERTERILLEVEQPFSNHNGGQITVGPDGFLYIALGDGGGGGDPLGSGQDTTTLLGSLLRIDPLERSDDLAYRIPEDNPFAGSRGQRNEIWSYGLRNPWRFSFDAATGDLWIADVGQGLWEEINYLPAGRLRAGIGANLGWNILEGDQPFDDGNSSSAQGTPRDYVPPVHVYGHEQGRCSVTGGYVYRGDFMEGLDGVYVFSDFCTGEVFGLRQTDDGRFVHDVINFRDLPAQVVSFGQGPEHELYIIEANGNISRIQTRRWDREVQVYGPDEEIPGGGFQVEVTPGPEDPVINNPEPLPDPEPEPEPDPDPDAGTDE